MNTGLEFHDSVLSEITQVKGHCYLRLRPAYVHRSEGQPGIDAGNGFSQDLTIEIGDAQFEELTITLPKKISDGWISIGDVRMSTLAPVPYFTKELVSITIIPATDSAPIRIAGSSIEILVNGAAVHIESFSGSTK